MRKLMMFNVLTLNGFFAGKDEDISWHRVDEEFSDFAIDQLESVDTLVFGRITYEGMESYWSTADAMRDAPQVAEKMNAHQKIVVSRTLKSADWKNSRLIKGDLVAEIYKLKAQDGKDMIIFGSGILCESLMALDLIDEYRLMLNPVALVEGVPMFKGLQDTLHLKLVNSRVFLNGNVLLSYQPDRHT